MMLLIILFAVLALGIADPTSKNELKKRTDMPRINSGNFGDDMMGVSEWTRMEVLYKRRWENGVIPYWIDKSLSDKRNLIMKAMEHFHSSTCLRFIPWNKHRDYIYLLTGKGCSSFVGRYVGGQRVSIGKYCNSVGVVIHELMHAVGFEHEQNRPDRDNWIRINWSNIQPGEEHNFQKLRSNAVTKLHEPYDYRSIMHYHEYAFARNPRIRTIIPKNPRVKIHYNTNWTASDIRRINKFYECKTKGI